MSNFKTKQYVSNFKYQILVKTKPIGGRGEREREREKEREREIM
jgi:hypothetical protein